MAEELGYERWRYEQSEARAEERWLGIGVSTLVQGTTPTQHDTAGRFGSMEMATITVLPDGMVEVRVGTKSQGQAHETSFAQVAASTLGVDVQAIAVRDGDTDALTYGQGTWGSRSAVMGGGAVITAASTVRQKMAAIGNHLGLEVAPVGPVRRAVITQIAAAAWWDQDRLPVGMDPGLVATCVYTPGFTGPDGAGGANHDETYTAAVTGVVVEVDAATGSVTVIDAVSVLDCGTVINPAVVIGQLRGAFAQGLGVAFLEEIRYGDDGQPQCATLLDYTIPTALDVPDLRVSLRHTPSDVLGGFRGVGETGIIAAPAVLIGAVDDALRPLGIRLCSTRAHPAALRAAVRANGWQPDPARWASP